MVIIWGSGLYGKVDEIEGVGHVATRFGHLYYIPLIPLSSMFVTGEDNGSAYGAPVGLSFKSILMAWARTVSVLAVIGSVILFLTTFQDGTLPAIIGGVAIVFAVLFAFMLRMKWAMQASHSRAVQLCEDIGFDPRLRVAIDLHYEVISEAEAERRMDELHATLEELENLDEEIEASGLRQEFDIK